MRYQENDKEKYKRINKKTGIYFLIKNDEVVYVGQTKRGLARIYNHEEKEWDSFYFVKVENQKDLLKKEKYFINKYKPIYNKELQISEKNSSFENIRDQINNEKIFQKEITTYNIRKFLEFINYKTKTKPITKEEASIILKIIYNNQKTMNKILEKEYK